MPAKFQLISESVSVIEVAYVGNISLTDLQGALRLICSSSISCYMNEATNRIKIYHDNEADCIKQHLQIS